MFKSWFCSTLLGYKVSAADDLRLRKNILVKTTERVHAANIAKKHGTEIAFHYSSMDTRVLISHADMLQIENLQCSRELTSMAAPS